jgi:hypothetical protein
MGFIQKPSLLRQALVEGVVAKEGHETDVAGEALEDVLGLLEAEAEGLSQRLERLRPMAQECDRASFFCGQLTPLSGLVHGFLPLAG